MIKLFLNLLWLLLVLSALASIINFVFVSLIFSFNLLVLQLFDCQESHIHSLMNVLRYCNLDESLHGEASLVCDNALDRLFKTKELDYMSYIVLRMFENTEVSTSY